MSLGQAEQQVIVALLTALVTIIPVATLVILAYLQVLKNRAQIQRTTSQVQATTDAVSQLPTHDDVQTAIDDKIKQMGEPRA